jgi:serine-type D-Ala-D-Ala carboxypeptidase (penicillin-binding protein 5/6)
LLYDIDKQPVIEGEVIIASCFIVYDELSGRVYMSKSPSTPQAIASLTKLMSAFVAYESSIDSDEYVVTREAVSSVKPSLGLQLGDQVKVVNLVEAMLVGSANDAALAISDFMQNTKEKDFVRLMNDKAREIGMTNTHFNNPTGFDSEKNYSTALDLQKLVQEYSKLPLMQKLGRYNDYSFKSKSRSYWIKATNVLVSSHPDLLAIKTGYTPEAKGAMVTKIAHGQKSFIIIVLGSENREKDTLTLKAEVESKFLK